eukprot:TRINITY_DN2339_c0_g6_i1.p1 TRINITY_DN2339_c0_g6~~TRINITY_DN2339_c0_g6_i1.p1  ORF type:complete len:230 (+),score=50.45 TRINITY_DN2339_c0_g6_i1:379-1068(+)
MEGTTICSREDQLNSGNASICQLLQSTNLFFILDLQNVLALTLSSRVIFQQLIPFISQHFTFYYSKHRPLNFYHPQKLKIQTLNIKDLFSIPFLNNLHEVEFYYNFNSPLPKLPSTVTHITLGNWYDQPLSQLPHKLTHIRFGVCFNQVVSEFNLPSSLTHIEFHEGFKQIITTLPPRIEEVIFHISYKQPISQLLLSSSIKFKTKYYDYRQYKDVIQDYQPHSSNFLF